MRLGIQADDLTGACDTGAVFAARGLETTVLLPEAPLPAPPPDVLVLDTESRGRPAAEARETVREAVARLAAARPARLYKKVDSTLRGALAAELAGALEGWGRRRAALLAPALPAQGRAVVGGLLRVHGRPASETAVARDPGFPPTGASLPALLGVAGPHPAVVVPLATVRGGPAAVARRLARIDAVFACDAETDADLAVLAECLDDFAGLVAGSAGLATAVAARLPSLGPAVLPALRPPLLVVAGSPHPVTAAQLDRLGGRDTRVLRPPAVAAGAIDRAVVAAGLAERAGREIGRMAPRTLLLTGGETAYSVCRALAATAIALAGEWEPGVPVGVLRDGPHAGLVVVTKAGGFGDPDTLARLDEACR